MTKKRGRPPTPTVSGTVARQRIPFEPMPYGASNTEDLKQVAARFRNYREVFGLPYDIKPPVVQLPPPPTSSKYRPEATGPRLTIGARIVRRDPRNADEDFRKFLDAAADAIEAGDAVRTGYYAIKALKLRALLVYQETAQDHDIAEKERKANASRSRAQKARRRH